MRSQTIRLGIFISTLVISAIVIFQLIWLKNVYNFEQKQFDHSIVQSIRGYYEDIHRVAEPAVLLSDQITRLNNETFLAKIDIPKNFDSLAYFMKAELEDENIYTDCYMGIYDAAKKSYVFNEYLPPTATAKGAEMTLPKTPQPFHHLTLYFPHRKQYILSLMNFWLITSALLLVVLILFGGSLYYFYRQKFLNETQKDFVNNFTHEFKTPVSVINLAAEVLENPDIIKNQERFTKYVEIVKYQGRYLQDQIERLLQYAYSESRLLHLYKERVDIHKMLEEATSNLQPLIEEKKAKISWNLSAQHFILKADHGYLLIVLTNLLENALKYSKDPEIIIATSNETGYIFISVKDNGKGIEKKHLNKIFRKFYRIPSGERVMARGFGLGLSFVKRIVNAHNGMIHVQSIPGKGSNFVMRLPLV